MFFFFIKDVVIPNGTDQLNFIASEEKEKSPYLNTCERQRLEEASNWVTQPTNLGQVYCYIIVYVQANTIKHMHPAKEHISN